MSAAAADHVLCRYAVLRHSGPHDAHFDFLFETAPNSPLVTFRLAEWPLTRDQEVTKLKDHRRLYLTYEGDIPGGRGRVDRVDEGSVYVTGGEGQGGDNVWSLRHADGQPYLQFESQGFERRDAWWVSQPGA